MKANDFLSTFEEIDQKYLREADPDRVPKKKIVLRVVFIAAAVALLASALTLTVFANKTQPEDPTPAAPVGESETTKTAASAQTPEPTPTEPISTNGETFVSETAANSQDGKYPLSFSSDNPKSMLLHNKTVKPDDAWRSAITAFAAVEISEKTDEETDINGVSYYKVFCKYLFGYGEITVKTPYGQVPKSGRSAGFGYAEKATVEEALSLYPFVFLPERMIKNVQNGDTILIRIDLEPNEYIMYCSDLAETKIASIENHPELYGSDPSAVEKAIERIRSEESPLLLYIPIINGKLTYDEKYDRLFQVNLFTPLNNILTMSLKIKAQYEEDGQLPNVFCSIGYLDILPDCTIQSGTTVDQFKNVLTWYNLCKKDYSAYVSAYDSLDARKTKWTFDPDRGVDCEKMKINLDGYYCMIRIDEITDETAVVNGAQLRKVMCSVLAGKEIGRNQSVLIDCRNYDCVYIEERLLAKYDVEDAVIFRAYVDKNAAKYRILMPENDLAHFKQGKLVSGLDSNIGELFCRLNLNLLNIKAVMNDGYDFHNHWIGDLIETLPETFFEAGMSEKDAAAILNWFFDLTERQNKAYEEYVAELIARGLIIVN